MGSLAHSLRKDLESRGEYVVTANASTGWFAVFSATWRDRTEKARRDGREGPNLVVYRTKSDSLRDHYVVPYAVIRELLAEDTMTTSEVNGSQRWNLTLKNGDLHVSHRAGAVPVHKYFGARLLLEQGGASSETVTDEQAILGGGFGRSEENRRVEEAAVQLVSERYRQEGWHVVSVEDQNCGFDLLCGRDGEEEHVEVKGVAAAGRGFSITAGELRCADSDHRFVLALVTSALSSRPVLERLPGETLRSCFTFTPLQYLASPRQEETGVSEAPKKGAAPEPRPRTVRRTPTTPRHGDTGHSDRNEAELAQEER